MQFCPAERQLLTKEQLFQMLPRTTSSGGPNRRRTLTTRAPGKSTGRSAPRPRTSAANMGQFYRQGLHMTTKWTKLKRHESTGLHVISPARVSTCLGRPLSCEVSKHGRPAGSRRLRSKKKGSTGVKRGERPDYLLYKQPSRHLVWKVLFVVSELFGGL